jgi:hypothetical protein
VDWNRIVRILVLLVRINKAQCLAYQDWTRRRELSSGVRVDDKNLTILLGLEDHIDVGITFSTIFIDFF